MDRFESGVTQGMSYLSQIIGSENVEDMKKRIGEAIVEKCKSDFAAYKRYILYPPDFEDEINEAYEKVSKKITKMYTDAMLEVAEKSVERFKELALKSFEEMERRHEEDETE